MAITDEFRGSAPTFLEGFTPDMAEGGGGEALLAVALAANDAQQRKAAKALLKKAKQPRLLAALKALPRRNYQSKVDALGDDLVAMGEVEGLDVAQLAFHLHQLLYRCEHTAAFFASQVPVDYLRGLIEASMEKHGQILLNESPWPSSKLLPLLPEYPAAKSVRVWLLDEGELPCLSGLTELAGLGIRGPGSLPPGCVEGVPLRGVTFQDSRVDSLAPLVGCPLELVRYSRGPLAELPDLGAWPALRELSIEDCELKELPSSIGALSALTELTLKRCGIRTLPPELAHMPALTELNLFDLEFDHLPEFVDAQPLDHVSCHGVTWPEFVSAGAGRLLQLPCTARVHEAFEGVVLSCPRSRRPSPPTQRPETTGHPVSPSCSSSRLGSTSTTSMVPAPTAIGHRWSATKGDPSMWRPTRRSRTVRSTAPRA